jgi:hypothetical protein
MLDTLFRQADPGLAHVHDMMQTWTFAFVEGGQKKLYKRNFATPDE